MPSADFFRWQRAGEPYTDCRPGATLTKTLRGHGYTVYTRGNDDHMEAVPPEDHTPFSQTGWPVESPEWFGHAVDIMPQGIPANCPTLAQLGDQMFNDKTANVPGARLIKYMNREPKGPGGPCYHDAWQPTHKRSASTDRGHNHVSFRSDATHSDEMAGYDPVQRWRDSMTEPLSKTQTRDAVVRTDDAVDNEFPWRADYPAKFPEGDKRANPKVQLQTAVIEAAGRGEAARAAAVDGTTAILARLHEEVAVTLTDAQLDTLADKVTARLQALVFKATP